LAGWLAALILPNLSINNNITSRQSFRHPTSINFAPGIPLLSSAQPHPISDPTPITIKIMPGGKGTRRRTAEQCRLRPADLRQIF
jgi:hypothetical protein